MIKFLNPSKESRARQVVRLKGGAPVDPNSAEAKAYARAAAAGEKGDDALVLAVYKLLGGAVVEVADDEPEKPKSKGKER